MFQQQQGSIARWFKVAFISLGGHQQPLKGSLFTIPKRSPSEFGSSLRRKTSEGPTFESSSLSSALRNKICGDGRTSSLQCSRWRWQDGWIYSCSLDERSNVEQTWVQKWEPSKTQFLRRRWKTKWLSRRLWWLKLLPRKRLRLILLRLWIPAGTLPLFKHWSPIFKLQTSASEHTVAFQTLPGVRRFTADGAHPPMAELYMNMFGFTYTSGEDGIAPAKLMEISALASSKPGLLLMKSTSRTNPSEIGRMVVFLITLFTIFGAGYTTADLASKRSRDVYDSLKRGEKPASYHPCSAAIASCYGAGLGEMSRELVMSFSGIFSLSQLLAVSLLSEPAHATLKAVHRSGGKSIEGFARSLMKGRRLQMERAAFLVLQAPRFVRDPEEEALLTELSQAGLSNPALSWLGFCSLVPSGTDAGAYYADLRDRVSYIVNGPAGYSARRSPENRKALEDRFRERQAASVALGLLWGAWERLGSAHPLRPFCLCTLAGQKYEEESFLHESSSYFCFASMIWWKLYGTTIINPGDHE